MCVCVCVWFSTTDVRARGKTSTALGPWAEFVRSNSTIGGGGPVWCLIWWGREWRKSVSLLTDSQACPLGLITVT